ncbi:hypothetical protein PG994_011524 [Apiospora phragmitis]|uniref:Uncharacterized protein n=1 Tax=Apiospora phragmitis TaxID=2905665 RepID=A0ABR1TT39_9PEZI
MAICYGLQHIIGRVTAAVTLGAVVALAVTNEQVAVSREIVYWVACFHESFGAEQTAIALVYTLATELVCGNAQCALFSRDAVYSADSTYPNVPLCDRLSCKPRCTIRHVLLTDPPTIPG